MAFTEDLTPFFGTSDFGVGATFTHGTGSSVTVNGIFDASYVDPLGIEGAFPRFVCAASDVSSVVHGDTLVVNSKTYKVYGVKPDGTGLMLLSLQEQ